MPRRQNPRSSSPTSPAYSLPPATRIGVVRWSYGVTTVPSRRYDLLPQTLASLTTAGFHNPRLFVDGDSNPLDWERQFPNHPITARWPPIRTAGNWVLSMYELYLRDPTANRYAIFQDDMVTYPNLRTYLETCTYPDDGPGKDGTKGYWNLYTFPSNQSLSPRESDGRERIGWYLSNQYGRGAVALVFSRNAVIALLGSQYLAERPQDCQRGHKAIDGGIVSALARVGWKEYVHNPSLVQHTGLVSAMGNEPHKLAESFRGADFNALSLIQ